MRSALHTLTLFLVLTSAPAADAPRQPADIPWLLPRPKPPEIVEIKAPEEFKPPDGIPVVELASDRVVTEWLFAGRIKGGWGERTATALGQDGAGNALKGLRPLEPAAVLRETYPEFRPAIDLRRLSNGRDNTWTGFCTVVRNDKPRLLRVSFGLCGSAVDARMWISGQPVARDEFVRVAPGHHPVVMEACSGRRVSHWLGWRGRNMGPLFLSVSENDIRALHEWELSRWQATLNGATADDAKLLESVKFDPKTIRGKAGFFRVGKSVNGKWWFIDPDGKAFYYRGVCSVNSGGMGGRRTGRPPVPKEKVTDWIAAMKSWGFNGLGSWTTKEFFDKGIAYCEIIETFYEQPWLKHKFPDVFDPAWARALDVKCKTLCTPRRDSKLFLGYFLDNERGFMSSLRYGETIAAGAPTYKMVGSRQRSRIAAEPLLDAKALGLLQFCLSLEDGKPAGKEAWDFVLKRYGAPKKAGQAWGVSLTDRGSVAELTLRDERLVSAPFLSDEQDFIRHWIAQYYKTATAAIRRYDPNHLILGVRWGGPPAAFIAEEEARWTDVISRNNYRAAMYERMDKTWRAADRPILIGEFPSWGDTFAFVRSPIEPPGGYHRWVRGELRHRESLDRSFSHPAIVGYTWYRWGGGKPRDKGLIGRFTRANHRTVSIATDWDRPAEETVQPPVGQISVCLQTGAGSTRSLPAPKPGAKSGTRKSTTYIVLGFVRWPSKWDSRVWGDGIKGEVTSAETEGAVSRIACEIKMIPGMFTGHRGEARYEIELKRDRTKLEGTFKGSYNGVDVSGRALGYIYRPVPNPNL